MPVTDPALVRLGIPTVAALVLSLIVAAARHAGVTRRGQLGLMAALLAWTWLTAGLAVTGVLARWAPPPPFLLLMVGGAALVAVLVASPHGRRVVDGVPLAALVAFHTFRFPLELVMHEAAAAGVMPPQMTWTGWNPDVLTGLSAPLVAVAYARGWIGRRAVAWWNLFGLVTLTTIVVVAVSSTPTFAAFGTEPAVLNTWIARVPYVWLPTVCVLGALAGHLAILRTVMRDSLIFGPWLSAAAFVEGLMSTVWHRPRRGPLLPSWGFLFEVVMTWLRDRFRVLSTAPPALVRRHVDVLGSAGSAVRGVTWSRTTIAGLPAAWATPRDAGEGVLFYLHGGGFVFGSLASHRGLISALAAAAGVRAVAVEYRLAPESPLPAAAQDALAAWQVVLASGVDPARVVFAGDSAGGGLCLLALDAIRDVGLPLPAGVVLLSPWTDLEVTGSTVEAHEHLDYLGDRATLVRYAGLAVGRGDRAALSPLHVDPRGLPPTLLLVGGAEVLLDDSVRLISWLRAGGVSVEAHVEPDQVHVYPMFGLISPAARRAVAQVGAWVRARLSPGPAAPRP